MLDKQSALPLYFQVEQYMLNKIKTGEYRKGTLIPSERELSERFQISRMTVRQAINNLVNRGLLTRERGKGTFVAQPKIAYPLKGVFSFTEDMKRRGLTPSTRVVSFHVESEPPPKVLNDLACEEGEKVLRLERIRFANEEPLALETAFLPYTLFKDLTEKDTEGSIYEYVRNRLQFVIKRAQQEIEASIVTERDRVLLDLPSESPVLVVHRTTYTEEDIPFESVKTVFRGDRYTFSITMDHEQGEG
ncbi:GntR family transcriptional regulator [Pseudalkalibacillus sp. SCS-8]|uniref:GntR family transcriptional regulator n=1 Tax=Pseudalkalibacillus nanhaiensis TaxID=3115291 RepID=UPI0032DB4944